MAMFNNNDAEAQKMQAKQVQKVWKILNADDDDDDGVDLERLLKMKQENTAQKKVNIGRGSGGGGSVSVGEDLHALSKMIKDTKKYPVKKDEKTKTEQDATYKPIQEEDTQMTRKEARQIIEESVAGLGEPGESGTTSSDTPAGGGDGRQLLKSETPMNKQGEYETADSEEDFFGDDEDNREEKSGTGTGDFLEDPHAIPVDVDIADGVAADKNESFEEYRSEGEADDVRTGHMVIRTPVSKHGGEAGTTVPSVSGTPEKTEKAEKTVSPSVPSSGEGFGTADGVRISKSEATAADDRAKPSDALETTFRSSGDDRSSSEKEDFDKTTDRIAEKKAGTDEKFSANKPGTTGDRSGKQPENKEKEKTPHEAADTALPETARKESPEMPEETADGDYGSAAESEKESKTAPRAKTGTEFATKPDSEPVPEKTTEAGNDPSFDNPFAEKTAVHAPEPKPIERGFEENTENTMRDAIKTAVEPVAAPVKNMHVEKETRKMNAKKFEATVTFLHGKDAPAVSMSSQNSGKLSCQPENRVEVLMEPEVKFSWKDSAAIIEFGQEKVRVLIRKEADNLIVKVRKGGSAADMSCDQLGKSLVELENCVVDIDSGTVKISLE